LGKSEDPCCKNAPIRPHSFPSWHPVPGGTAERGGARQKKTTLPDFLFKLCYHRGKANAACSCFSEI
jgi:hypothetical protein